jgi:chemotaxis protein methyltransferase CheR
MVRADTDSASFDRLLTYIEDTMGFATSSYNDAYLDRRISARMRRSDTDTYRGYRRLLDENDTEQAALLDALSVNVTSFFRNPEVWEALRDVLADLSQHRRTRVWSAASSDGREAYSLAMLALDDPRVNARRVEILGTDIKPAILSAARNGVYHASETNDLASQLDPLDDFGRYVERTESSYRVTDQVRRLVEFRRHDLINEDPPGTFDLVLCRNLFIYIDSAAKDAVFRTLGSALEPGGYLTIGMTETVPPACRDWFEPVEKRRRVYRRTDVD